MTFFFQANSEIGRKTAAAYPHQEFGYCWRGSETHCSDRDQQSGDNGEISHERPSLTAALMCSEDRSSRAFCATRAPSCVLL